MADTPAAPPPRRSPPAVLAPAPFDVPRVERATLANGMRVLLVPRRNVPLIDIHLVVLAGGDGDAPAHAGRTALAAALIDEQTAGRSAAQIADALEFVGAELDIRAGWDATTIAVHVLAPHARAALDVLGDIAANATLPEAAFQRRRAERRAEWLADRTEPATLAGERLHRAIYGDAHPYAEPLNGTDSSLAALRRDDVAALHASRFVAGNAFIVAVGDFAADTFVSQLEAAFSGWRGDAPDPARPAAAPACTGTIHLLARPGAPQSEVRAGLAGPPRADADHAAVLVLNTVLGGAFTSRLNHTLREEKGYTYGVHSRFALRRGPGPFIITTAVASDATADTVREIVTHVTRICDEPVPAAELDRARRYLALGFPRQLEAGDRFAAQLAQLEVHALGDDFLHRHIERILAVTADDVLEAARRHLDPAALHFAIAGDPARCAAGLADLAIAPLLVEGDDTAHFRP